MFTTQQLQKEINKHIGDPKVAYMFAMLGEAVIENNKQLNKALDILNATVDTIGKLAGLNEALEGKMVQLLKEVKGDPMPGISVHSEPGQGN